MAQLMHRSAGQILTEKNRLSNQKGVMLLPIGALRKFPPFATLLECQLETGRTHQIRVHMAHIGRSIIGDPLYGRAPRAGQMPDATARECLAQLRSFGRQALHAAHRGFAHPVTGEALCFKSQLPEDMRTLIRLMDGVIATRARGGI